jgi:hypothetical protein
VYEALDEERGIHSLGMAGFRPAAICLKDILTYLDYLGIRGGCLRRDMVRRVKSLDRTRIALWSESAAKEDPK